MDIDVEVSQTVSPNDTEKASNNNVVNTNVGNNKKHSQPTGSQGQLPSHKPHPIVVDHCENLNGLIRSTDKFVDQVQVLPEMPPEQLCFYSGCRSRCIQSDNQVSNP